MYAIICDEELEDQKIEEFWLINGYYVVLDSLILNMNDRFSAESLKLAVSVDQLFKMNFENSMNFFDHFMVSLSIYNLNVV